MDEGLDKSLIAGTFSAQKHTVLNQVASNVPARIKRKFRETEAFSELPSVRLRAEVFVSERQYFKFKRLFFEGSNKIIFPVTVR